MNEIKVVGLDENLDLELDLEAWDENDFEWDLDLDFEDEVADASDEFKWQVDWLLWLNMNEVNSPSVFVWLRTITDHFLKKINELIDTNNIKELYGEAVIFQVKEWKIVDISAPFLVHPPRTDEQWYLYKSNAQIILDSISDAKWKLKEEYSFNNPIWIEWADWLRFDVVVVTDTWLMIFLNKKERDLKEWELNNYSEWIKKMVLEYEYKLKLRKRN